MNRYLALALVAVVLKAAAFGPADLVNAEPKQFGKCMDTEEEELINCVFLEKEKRAYIVYVDEKGIKVIYQVPKFQPIYKAGDMHKLWHREDI